jgi:tetratricopeptide (TPR) repeat protein
VRALFDALNQALERQDKALAQTKLQGIQSQLAESSVARLRAESWFAHQTGDLDNASRIYRRLLEKMPGDELTSVNLASIEKKRQRPDEAKAVLAKALRQNPSSGVLRSAVEQLAQSEVRP